MATDKIVIPPRYSAIVIRPIMPMRHPDPEWSRGGRILILYQEQWLHLGSVSRFLHRLWRGYVTLGMTTTAERLVNLLDLTISYWTGHAASRPQPEGVG